MVCGKRAGHSSSRTGDWLAYEIARLVDIGVLNSGDHLPAERELATIFGVSRQTIRSAITELERNLIVTKRAGKETRLNGGLRLQPKPRPTALTFPSSCTPQEMLDVRVAVETEVVLRVMEKSDPETLDALAAIGDLQCNKELGPVGLWLVDLSFQLRLVEATGNSLMISLSQDLYFATAPLADAVPRLLPLGQLVEALHAKSAKDAARYVRESLALRLPSEPGDEVKAFEPSAHQTSHGRKPSGNFAASRSRTDLFWPGFTPSAHRA